jgi:hypothetical protein
MPAGAQEAEFPAQNVLTRAGILPAKGNFRIQNASALSASPSSSSWSSAAMCRRRQDGDHPQGAAVRDDHDRRRRIGAFLISNDMAGGQAHAQGHRQGVQGREMEDGRLPRSSVPAVRTDPPGPGQPRGAGRTRRIPETSAIFGKYPKIQHDHEAVELICDTLRAASMNYDDPHQVEEVLDKRMEATLHHAMHSSHALQTMADGLPALGIVAAVLGVIKTMGRSTSRPKCWAR